MRPLTLTISASLTFVAQLAHADCDAELLSALRTRYTMAQDLTLHETVFRLVCDKSSSDKGTSLSATVKSFGLGFGQSGRSTAEACTKNDTSFFMQNRQQIGLSFVPDKAIDGCFGGLSFTSTQTPDGRIVTVAAAYAPRGGASLAKVDSVRWEPKSALNCSVNWEGVELIPGGRNFTCTREQNVDVSMTLNTTEGQRQLVVPRTPAIERRPMQWTYVVNQRETFRTKCRNQFGELVGDWRSCYSDGTCNNADAIRAMCRTLYGSEYLTIDGVRVAAP